MKLLLFDVDGTLIRLDGAGLRSLDKTFYDVFNIKDIAFKVQFAGKTDPAIYDDILAIAGLDSSLIEIRKHEIKERFLQHLDYELTQITYNPIIPGINEYLEINSKKKDRIIGLLTGNIEEGAYKKIATADLNKYIKFGSFGSDSKIRSDLVEIAVNRAKTKFNISSIDKNDIFVIGDTPLDIKCAKDNKVISVAVATGKYTFDELQKYKPDYCLKNIMEFEKICP